MLWFIHFPNHGRFMDVSREAFANQYVGTTIDIHVVLRYCLRYCILCIHYYITFVEQLFTHSIII